MFFIASQFREVICRADFDRYIAKQNANQQVSFLIVPARWYLPWVYLASHEEKQTIYAGKAGSDLCLRADTDARFTN